MKYEVARYFDDYNMIVQLSNRDGGDSMNRMGLYWLAIFIYSNEAWDYDPYYKASVGDMFTCWNLLECKDRPGVFKRHPDPTKWYSHCDRMSRDQSIPALCAWAFHDRMRPYLWRYFKAHLKRGLLFSANTRHNFMYPELHEHTRKSTPDVLWNYKWKLPDITLFSFWSMYIRGFRLTFLYPLLMVLDVHFLLSCIFTTLSKSKHVDKIVPLAALNSRVMPTPVSWLGLKALEPKDLIVKMRAYFDGEDAPWLATMWEKIIRKF